MLYLSLILTWYLFVTLPHKKKKNSPVSLGIKLIIIISVSNYVSQLLIVL